MNNQAINEAFNRISKRRVEAISTYDKHIEEVEKKIPEIAQINNAVAQTNGNVLKACLIKGIDVKSKIEEIKRANQYAQSKTAELLKKYGYPEDYLEIKYHCPKCCDTGYYNDDYCDCVKLLTKQINAEFINKNSRLKLCSFDTFQLNYYSPSNMINSNGVVRSEYNVMMEVFNDCKTYADMFSYTSPNLLMLGRTGLGKTHLSLSIGKCVMEKGFNVIYGSVSDILSTIEKEKFAKFGTTPENDTTESVLTTDLLILDDLGAEFDNKFYKSVIYNIINTRYTRSLPIIISTNLSIDDLEDKYEERITSRLMSYQFIEFYGSDIRMCQEQQKKGYDRNNFKNNSVDNNSMPNRNYNPNNGIISNMNFN